MIGFRLERDYELQPPKGGECVGHPTNWWFPEKAPRSEEWANIRKARDICAVCKVRKECLDYAIEANEQHGIWGGMSWEQRKVEIRERRKKGIAVLIRNVSSI